MTKCRKCNKSENLIINKFKKSGYESLCKECCIIQQQSEHNKNIYNEWYGNNRDRLIKKSIENREKRRMVPKRVLLTEYEKLQNKKDSYKRNKEKRKLNTLYKLSDSVSNLIRCSINRGGYKKKSRSEDILGCSYIEFKNYIESKFEEEMSWSNYGDWHIDHIIPISWGKSEKEIYDLNNYKNLQPLWAKDNLSKGNILNRKIVNIKHIEKINEIKNEILKKF